MQARITDPAGFRCAPNGHTTITIPCGEIVADEVARWAVEMGKAEWLETKVILPRERKRK